MEDSELFLKFFGGLLALMLIGVFTYGILDSRQKHQERMLAIQKCTCMEVQK
jgi:hypothetical protein